MFLCLDRDQDITFFRPQAKLREFLKTKIRTNQENIAANKVKAIQRTTVKVVLPENERKHRCWY
ncbi:hypothetical protein HMSSN036_43830 [Paenibacillus macerans]|nr:hypothetical protein HMSSN036_43830 [Paenibacillus macerans]